MTSSTLVIGGGGVAGIAWATGMLLGLERAGVHLRAADRLIGTSAGSAVAAQLTSTLSLDELFERQTNGTSPEIHRSLGIRGMMNLAIPLMLNRDTSAALRSVGRRAAGHGHDMATARHGVIAARLPSHDWSPDHDLRLVAIDVETGERVVFTRDSGVDIVDAVEASCAVPGVWPVVHIGGQRYMDGGVSSPANVDLAIGSDRVVVIAPIARAARREARPQAELERLAVPGLVVSPDATATAAMGSNLLDPSSGPLAARAGLEQASREASAIMAVWAH